MEKLKKSKVLRFFYQLPFVALIYHYILAFLGALIYGFPSRKIFVVGVTGTKGKSTTIELIDAILTATGKKVAVSSSVRHGGSAMTMPGRFFLQKFLRTAVNNSCDYALIEVTSQGILQSRHRFIKWDAAIFTNLAPEHIESHGSFEKYREAKKSFFTYIGQQSGKKVFFINKDDDNAKYFIAASEGGEIILYGKSDLPNQLAGEFNKYNIGAAAAFTRSQNISEEVICQAVANFEGVAGRMEFVQKKPFAVVIDYAHTPDSLEKVYKTLKPEKGKLVCVLGCAGGGRDKWKRPVMGKIAAQYCDQIILTDEDPYDENPHQILSEIKSGISNVKAQMSNIYEIIDRQEAIKKAINLAKAGDTVIITGKGSEKWLHLGRGRKIPWNDGNIVKEVLKH